METSGKFYFDPEDKIYADHFPGSPVVPGSLIVHAFLQAAGVEPASETYQLKQFKFKQFLIPGEYDYTLHKTDNYIKCSLYDGAKQVVTGEIFV